MSFHLGSLVCLLSLQSLGEREGPQRKSECHQEGEMHGMLAPNNGKCCHAPYETHIISRINDAFNIW
jgi:hypothetical protein